MRTHIEIGQTLVCHKTGKSFIATVDGCTTNYATDTEGNAYSDEGINPIDMERIRDHSKPIGAYISSDGKNITGWKGNILAKITQMSTSRTGWHGSDITHIRAVDQFGGRWYGKGSGRGMYITIRPVKKGKK